MNREIICCVLVASLLFSIGCYSTEMVRKEELKAKAEHADITVYTKDYLEYKFSKGNYSVQRDTLTGWSRVLTVPSSTSLSFQERVALLESGRSVSANTSARDSVVNSIALGNVTSIKTEQFDLPLTLVTSVIGGLGLFVVLVLIGLSQGTLGK